MPQLMPLMWVSSVIMSLLIFVMLIIMYSYMELSIIEVSKSVNVMTVEYKW